MKKASLVMHAPRPQEVVLKLDRPWEGPICGYFTLIRDGDRNLLYYRGWPEAGRPDVYCVAESSDGIQFDRPNLGLHEYEGNRDNNIILTESPFTHTFAPFLDTRPDVEKPHRFKAFARNRINRDNAAEMGIASDSVEAWINKWVLNAFSSPDGINWRLMFPEPAITDGVFDSQNVGFWSEAEEKYIAYYRTFSRKEEFESGRTAPTTNATRLRTIMRAESEDFRHWSPGVLMDYRTGDSPTPVEEFYINQTHPYFRAPHIYVALPARFMKGRTAVSREEAQAVSVLENQINACSDACFMTTRPGNHWYDRTFPEAFVRPRIGAGHWTGRTNYPVNGVIQTGPEEMSFYVQEHYAQPVPQLRRYSLRLDGFSSVRMPHSGGEFITKPLTFSGAELELNYSTSAAGSMRVEIRDENNKPIPGYTLREATDIFGNRIAGRAAWKNGSSLAELAGKPVRLRFVMHDADLFSLRFV
ncbi:MAG: hypothetical protein ACOCWJ_04760 [Verrucomicrobiota bacterium]